jgi:hypothetical protein
MLIKYSSLPLPQWGVCIIFIGDRFHQDRENGTASREATREPTAGLIWSSSRPDCSKKPHALTFADQEVPASVVAEGSHLRLLVDRERDPAMHLPA